MDYRVDVIFTSPTCSPAFTFTDFIGDDDYSCPNYWDDIGEIVSYMICDAEAMFRKLHPNGHDYSLSKVTISHVGDEEE